jgi:hypothetical protein
MSWDAISAISTLVGAIVVSVTAVFLYYQLKEMTAARWVEAVPKVFDMLINNDDTSRARRYIRTHDLPSPGQASPEVYEQMWKVWVSFDNLGVMISFKMLPAHLPLEMFYSTVIECWEKLEPHIMHERSKRTQRYQVFFEDLYHRSIEYRDRYYPEDPQLRSGRNETPIQLRRKGSSAA